MACLHPTVTRLHSHISEVQGHSGDFMKSGINAKRLPCVGPSGRITQWTEKRQLRANIWAGLEIQTHTQRKYFVLNNRQRKIMGTIIRYPEKNRKHNSLVLMMHGGCGTLEPSMCTATHLELCNSYQKLTRFACVTLTYRISQRQENPVCPERKPVCWTGGWQAGCLMAQSLLIKSGSAVSVVGKLPPVTL